jgi:hypothetical protein
MSRSNDSDNKRGCNILKIVLRQLKVATVNGEEEETTDCDNDDILQEEEEAREAGKT